MKRRKMRTINEIIVHCTATAEGKDYTVEDMPDDPRMRLAHTAKGITRTR